MQRGHVMGCPVRGFHFGPSIGSSNPPVPSGAEAYIRGRMAMKPVPFALASEEEQARRLLTLLDDILQLPAEPAAVACCSAKLDQFVGDWLLGVDVTRQQPAVWQHLQVVRAAGRSLRRWLSSGAGGGGGIAGASRGQPWGKWRERIVDMPEALCGLALLPRSLECAILRPLQTQLPTKSLAALTGPRLAEDPCLVADFARLTLKPTSLHLIGFYPDSCSPRTRGSQPHCSTAVREVK